MNLCRLLEQLKWLLNSLNSKSTTEAGSDVGHCEYLWKEQVRIMSKALDQICFKSVQVILVSDQIWTSSYLQVTLLYDPAGIAFDRLALAVCNEAKVLYMHSRTDLRQVRMHPSPSEAANTETSGAFIILPSHYVIKSILCMGMPARPHISWFFEAKKFSVAFSTSSANVPGQVNESVTVCV